jgi:thymidylate synthase (FAD)
MRIDVLDHGYVRLVEDWGRGDAGEPEAGIVEAARQSTQGSFRGWDQGDDKLLRFMARNRHDTPFEFCGMVVEVQAPLFVFREWHRHRTQSYNEMSARYAPMPDVHFLPPVARCATADPANKQAGKIADAPECDPGSAAAWLSSLADLYDRSEAVYADGLARGVPKEVARLAVVVARYSRMRATANLRNWLAFVSLRSDAKAQKEIRVYSDAVGAILAARFPRTWALFLEGRSA